MKRGKLLKTTFVTLMVCATAGTLFACGGDPVTYKAVYVGGEGATGDAPATVSYEEGAKFNLAENTFTKAGYTFDGWSDGTSTYGAGVEYTMGNADVTFTAQWKLNSTPVPDKYTVTYALGDHAASDATAPAAATNVEKNAQVTLPAGPKAAEGYEFTGWKVGTDTTLKQAGDKITVTANVTVTAQWGEKAPAPVDDYRTDEDIKTEILNWWTDGSLGYYVGDGEELTVQTTIKLTEVQAWFGILTDIEFNGNFYRFRPDCQVFFLDNPAGTAHNTWTEDPADYNLEIDRTNWDETKYKGLYADDGSAIQVIKIGLKDKVLTVTLTYYAGTDTELETPVTVAAYKATTESDTVEVNPHFYSDHAVISAASAKVPVASNTFVNLTFDFDTEGVEDAVVPMRPGKDNYKFGSDPVKNGYKFLGWKSSDATDEKLYKDTEEVAVKDAVTYTAQWEQETYTVTYALGENAATDATAPAAVGEKHYGDKINLPAAPAAAANYVFAGWKVGDDTTLKAAEAEIEIKGTVTITAQFKKVSYTVTYALGDHAAADATAPAAEDIDYDAECTLPAAPAAAEKYEFAGWKVGDDVELKQAGDKFTPTAATTVTAQWKKVQFTVTYAKGDHAAEDATVTAEAKHDVDSEITLPAAPAAATGYTFDGWKVGEDTALKAVGDKVTVTENVTITAMWKANKITVTFDKGDHAAADATVENVQADYDTEITLPAAPAAEAGFAFSGWKVGDDTTLKQTGDKVKITVAVTITAQWVSTESSWTVTFLANEDDTTAHSTVSVAKDAENKKFTLPATAPVKDGFRFLGWYVSTDTDKTVLTTDTIPDVESDITLIGKWQAIFTVAVLDDLEGTAVEGAKTVYDNNGVEGTAEKFVAPTAPTKDGFSFVGWFEVVEGESGKEYGSEVTAATDITKSMTIAAKWEEDTFKVTYELGANAATDATAPEAVDIKKSEGKVTLPDAPAAATNYAFAGWKVGDDAELKAEKTEIDVTADVTVTAMFIQVAETAEHTLGTWGQTLPQRFTLSSGHFVEAEVDGYTITANPVEAFHGFVTQIMPKGNATEWYFFQANAGTARVEGSTWQWETAANGFTLSITDGSGANIAIDDATLKTLKETGKTITRLSLVPAEEGKYQLTAVTKFFAADATDPTYIITRTRTMTDSSYFVYLALDGATKADTVTVTTSIPTAENPVALTSTAYKPVDYVTQISKGEKVTLKGNLQGGTGQWNAPVVVLMKDVDVVALRLDDYANGQDNVGNMNWAALEKSNNLADFTGAWTDIVNLIAACEEEITIDWTTETQIVVTMKCSKDDKVFTQTYTIKAAAEKTLEDQYNLSIGSDSCTYTINSFVRTAAPAAE